MELEQAWNKYSEEVVFNSSVMSNLLEKTGQKVTFQPGDVIVSQGEFPAYIYFIKKGVATGVRNYEDGNQYEYFQVDYHNGNIGLLEVLARKEYYVATISCLTEVEVIKTKSVSVYEYIMADKSLLRRCTVLLANDLFLRSGSDGLFYHYKGIDRLRHYLVYNYEQRYQRTTYFTLNESYETIGSKTGMSIRTVGRSLQKLKENNEISNISRKIQITESQYIRMKGNIQ